MLHNVLKGCFSALFEVTLIKILLGIFDSLSFLMFAIIVLVMEKVPLGSRSQYAVTQRLFPLLTRNIYFQELGEHGKGKDFISLGLQNGHLVFR